MKISKKFLTLALTIGVVSAPLIANAASNSPNEGGKTYFGGEYTYADAWSGWYNKNCYLDASLGNQSYTSWKKNWNQTKLKALGEHELYHTHDYEDLQ